MGELVSIVIPCYNVEAYIPECLTSLQNQTYISFEIICVDDGSEDNTREIIEKFVSEDRRIKLVCQEHSFAGSARNLGMDYAKGEYLFFLDADDYYDSTLLEKMVICATEKNLDIVVCDAFFMDNITGEITKPSHILNKEKIAKYDVFSKNDFPNGIVSITCYGPWTKLYRRSFIEKNHLRFMSTKRNNDIYFTYISMILANRIGSVNERLIYYRTNNSCSLQGTISDVFSKDFYAAFCEIKNRLQEYGLYDENQKEYLNRLVAQCNSVLLAQKDYKHFVEAFSFIKEIVFSSLDVYAFIDKLEYQNELRVHHVLNMNANEYLFNIYSCKKDVEEMSGEIPPKLLEGVSRIAIFGAGRIGKVTFSRYVDKYTIVGWYDNNYDVLVSKGLKLNPISELNPSAFDKIIIAIFDSEAIKEIRELLINRGVDEKQIVSGYLL